MTPTNQKKGAGPISVQSPGSKAGSAGEGNSTTTNQGWPSSLKYVSVDEGDFFIGLEIDFSKGRAAVKGGYVYSNIDYFKVTATKEADWDFIMWSWEGPVKGRLVNRNLRTPLRQIEVIFADGGRITLEENMTD